MQTIQLDLPVETKTQISDIHRQIIEIKSNLQPKQPEEYLSRIETAELLKINLSTLYLWTKKGSLKSYGIAGKVYYKRSEIELALISLND